MSREALKNLIELVPEQDIETLFRVIVKFVPGDIADQDEIEAIVAAKRDIEENGTVSHKDINWD
ncbi:hypothetical protein [Lacrimispora celerecrescens]|uniref:Uncharacterized protein n=1 Tax=[Clostridium] celerecrescens 18A TaxID=1286362 RepID=A0A2M8Z2Y8_9FIRM|nr:hypothetical protein [Lacrimispora celerecrescens]PJJ27791.1 hypothetical protein H171_1270 [[Clostridium] celerecrescens 18A]